MNRKISAIRTIGVFSFTGLSAFLCLGVNSIAVRAQAKATESQGTPDSAALKRKVEAMEKQVELLTKQVEELKKQRNTFTLVQPSQRIIPPDRWQPERVEPPPGTPFQFNGRTYYRSLLDSKAQATASISANPATGASLTLTEKTLPSAVPVTGTK